MKALAGLFRGVAGFALWSTLAGCVAAQGPGRTTWQEEVLLHDGRRIIVDREVQRGGRREVGQRPPIREQTLRFRDPADSREVTWTDAFDRSLGMANFLPMMLEVHRTGMYLVAYPMGCTSYNKCGRSPTPARTPTISGLT